MSRRSWWFVLVPSFGNSQADSFRATPGGHAKPVIAVLRHRRWWWSDGWVVYRHALLVEG